MRICEQCRKPVALKESMAIGNNRRVHRTCYEDWSEDQARLRQKEEDEL